MLRFIDAEKLPGSGLKFEARLRQHENDKDDRAVDFKELEAGLYAADVALAPGAWVISLSTRGEGESDPLFRLKRRLFVEERQ
jgi:nitrogen fixation protein FixH